MQMGTSNKHVRPSVTIMCHTHDDEVKHSHATMCFDTLKRSLFVNLAPVGFMGKGTRLLFAVATTFVIICIEEKKKVANKNNLKR